MLTLGLLEVFIKESRKMALFCFGGRRRGIFVAQLEEWERKLLLKSILGRSVPLMQFSLVHHLLTKKPRKSYGKSMTINAFSHIGVEHHSFELLTSIDVIGIPLARKTTVT